MGFFMITENENLIESIIKQALAEDLGESGDVTSLAIFSTEDQASAIIKSKASGILSGAYLIPKIFNILNPSVQCDIKVKDGDVLEKGTVICKLQGPVHAILGGDGLRLTFCRLVVSQQAHQSLSRRFRTHQPGFWTRVKP